MKTLLTLAGIVALTAAAGCSRDRDKAREEAQPRTGTTEPQRAPDNTGKNERAPGGQTVPAGDQKANADMQITREIRAAIVEDDELSTDAEDVKIVTVEGVVTLAGPVDSETEKKAIERKARTTAGVVRVDNQLDVDQDDDKTDKADKKK